MQNGTTFKNKKVGVLMGGFSAAREVSIQTGEVVYQTLVDRGYKVSRIFVDRDVDLVLRQSGIEVAFLALHGRYGEDGCIQGLLELMGIPYTGSGVTASALAMNKVKSKEIFRLRNLPTPPYYVIDPSRLDSLVAEHGSFGFPVVVKPCSLGSSVGVAIVRNHHELRRACEDAFLFDSCVIVERYIRGMEIQVCVLDQQVLGAIEVVPKSDFFNYKAKTSRGHCEYHYPARLSAARYQGVLTQALKAHQALGCSGLTLVDMLLSNDGNEFLLEINSLPSFTSTSLAPKIAHGAGMDFADLVEEILDRAALKSRGEAIHSVEDARPYTINASERRLAEASNPN
ncbi:MAG: D-alanine--D-alanine ligase [bacterium]